MTNLQLYTTAPSTVVVRSSGSDTTPCAVVRLIASCRSQTQRIIWLQNFLNAHTTSADAAAAARAPALAAAGPANPRPPPPPPHHHQQQQQRNAGGAGSGYTSASTDSTVTPSPVPSSDAYSLSPSSEGTPGSGASDTAELQAVAHGLSLEPWPQQADDADADDPDDDGGDVAVTLPQDAVDQLDPLAYLMFVDIAALEALTDSGRPSTAPPGVFDSWSIVGVSARPAAQGEESAASASVASPAPRTAGSAASPAAAASAVPWSRQANPNAMLIDAAVALTDDVDDRDGRTYRGPRAMPAGAAASPAASTPIAPAPWSSSPSPSPSPHGARRTRDLSSTGAAASPAVSRSSASTSPFQMRDLATSLPSTRPQVGLTTAEACDAIRKLLAQLESLKVAGAVKP